MNKQAQTKIVFNRRKNGSVTKKASVEIEVSYNGKRKWISTGVCVYTSEWHHQSMVVRRNDANELNTIINSMRACVNKVILDCMERGIEFSFSALSAGMEKTKVVPIREFIDQYLDDKHLSDGTRLKYYVLRNDLDEYEKLKNISDVTEESLIEYDRHLHKKMEGKITDAGTYDYHKCLRALCRYAVTLKYISEDPYKYFHPSRGKAKLRIALTQEQVALLASAELKDKTLDAARDLFLFQSYTGLSYVDMTTLDYHKCIRSTGNKKVIIGSRVKSLGDYYIVLVSAAIRILEKYDYKLPKYTIQAYNRNLKDVCEAVGLDTKVTSHVGRHTFACIAINSGIAIEVISKILGHTNVKTTQLYAKIANRFVDDGFSVLEKVFA